MKTSQTECKALIMRLANVYGLDGLILDLTNGWVLRNRDGQFIVSGSRNVSEYLADIAAHRLGTDDEGDAIPEPPPPPPPPPCGHKWVFLDTRLIGVHLVDRFYCERCLKREHNQPRDHRG